VVILEKAQFPRHKVGEGLIVDVNRILADLGALEAVEAEDFPKKYGSTFLWGADRRPSTFLFRDGQALVGAPDGYQLEYTWHVDRPRYDAILADTAASHGAEFIHGATVTGVVESDGRVQGVLARMGENPEQEIRADWVIDCGGVNGPLARDRGVRTLDAELRNIAMFGYFRGVGWREDLQGPPALRRTLILTHPKGWVWLIPVSREVVSVGFVTRLEGYQAERSARGADLSPESLYFEVLKELPEYGDLLADAEVFDYREEGRLVHTIQEFSFTCQNITGPGWALCGDAAGFVDAILSVGCFVAQAHAQFLAYALVSALDRDCAPELAMESYETTVQENLAAFRAITHMFYAFNSDQSEWWRECSDVLRASSLVPDGADKEAFLTFVNGFSTRHALYEEAVNSFGGLFLMGLGQSLFDGEETLFDEAAATEETGRARALIGRDPRLRMASEWDVRDFALPHSGRGRLRPVARLEVAGSGAGKGHGISRRIFIPSALEGVPSLLDGTRRLSEVAVALHGAGVGADADGCRREVLKLAYRLAVMGVVEECGLGRGDAAHD